MKKFLFAGLVTAFLSINTNSASINNSDLKMKSDKGSDQVALVIRRKS